ncbi:uncharacterized protein TRIVIDRAFT_223083 [Trichoderma virens Gv29-8]|uniref:Uncharacterized protein n=1 Tax=Hypocrea virens (strain Gv29-8 / FGSC 10586) TaxID=413071 RepID=G9MW15_HYPVG|nr:uncharacterized protein TRIVIDRAFT_223083 [Trichoderma virens Gv29-8]EHK21311.1 hypothetical protein TRIVIDRAFT_223083 [Trichoderma virens Gv29-8]
MDSITHILKALETEKSSNDWTQFTDLPKVALVQIRGQQHVLFLNTPIFNISDEAMVVWTTPQNAQIDDAVRRMKALMPDRVIFLIHSWGRGARHVQATRIAQTTLLSINPFCTKQQLVAMANKQAQAVFQDRSPAADPFSLSSQLRRKNVLEGFL